MTLDEIFAGIRDSIANARPDVQREHGDVLRWLAAAVDERHLQKTMALLERMDILDHYPAVRRPDGRLEPQPMPGGWPSWYGWMMTIRAYEEAPTLAAARQAATPDIPEEQIRRTTW